MLKNKPNKVEVNKEEITRLRSLDYYDYLHTDHWCNKRNDTLKFFNYKCCVCGETQGKLVVHHNDYYNLGREIVGEDLFLLCDECHNELHECVFRNKGYFYIFKNHIFYCISGVFHKYTPCKSIIDLDIIDSNKIVDNRKKKKISNEQRKEEKRIRRRKNKQKRMAARAAQSARDKKRWEEKKKNKNNYYKKRE